jgi:hypothetical protein
MSAKKNQGARRRSSAEDAAPYALSVAVRTTRRTEFLLDQAGSLDRLLEKVCDLVAPFFGVVDRHFCGLIRTLFDVSTRI